MKKILSLVLISALGGCITLGAYKLFVEDEAKVVYTTTETQPSILPASNTSLYGTLESTDFTAAAKSTVDAVVHVKNTALVSSQPTFEDLFFNRRSQRAQVGTGSGVIISPDGYIITNNHVIEGSQALSVTLNNNKTYDAEIIGTDPKTDIALLKVEANEDLPYTTFANSDNVKIGEWALAVGNPFNLTSTVTAGIISAKSRALSGATYQSFLQTDAAVNPGNSGGALVNINGELIGINTAITSQTGSYVGYAFAVPSNVARKVVEDIMEFGNVQNALIGINGGTINSNFAKENGIKETEGVYISDVTEGSGADKAGLQSGDIIKKLDNVNITKFSDLRGFLNAKRPNDVINVMVDRNGDLKTFNVKLSKKETINLSIIGELKNPNSSELKKAKVRSGLKITKFNPEVSEEWTQEGIDKGDFVTAINGEAVNNIDDVENIVKNSRIYHIKIVKTDGEEVNYRFRR